MHFFFLLFHRRRRASSVDSQTSEQSDTEEGDGVGVACEGGGVGGASEDDEPQKVRNYMYYSKL